MTCRCPSTSPPFPRLEVPRHQKGLLSWNRQKREIDLYDKQVKLVDLGISLQLDVVEEMN